MNIFEDTENSKENKTFCWNTPILNLNLDNLRKNDTKFERKLRRFKWKYAKQKQHHMKSLRKLDVNTKTNTNTNTNTKTKTKTKKRKNIEDTDNQKKIKFNIE